MAVAAILEILLVCSSFLMVSSTPYPEPSKPLPPSHDLWYRPTPLYELTEPGTVLRIRPAAGNATSVITNASAAYNILYRTTDTHNLPSWAVTTLFIPSSAPADVSDASNSLLSYQIAYDSPDIDASPSFLLPFYTADLANLETALGRGWFVSVPDYEGPKASFTLGTQSGHAVIDSVRSVLNSGLLTGLHTRNTRSVLWGYSGGALATGWAAELQPRYAPDVRISGAVLGGLPASVRSTMQAVNSRLYSGLIPLALMGMASQYPDLHEHIVATLKPTGPFNRTTFLSVQGMNWLQGIKTFAYQDIYDYFINGEKDLLAPVFQNVLNNDGQMGLHGIPELSLFVYQAIQDEVAVVDAADAVIQRYCAGGANILYQRNTVGNHTTENVNGKPRAWDFLESVLGGTYYSREGCTVQTVTVNVTSETTS